MNYGQNHSTDATQQLETQALLTHADTNLDSAVHLQKYQQAEQQLVDDVAWLPVAQQIASYLQKPCVKGSPDDAYGITPPDDWSKIFISTTTPCANTSRYF